MEFSINSGDRVALRDRPWRVVKVLSAVGDRHIVECEALDGDTPGTLSAVIPPEEASPLPNQEVQFDLHGLDSFASWSRSHLMLGATLIRETGLLTGARFGRVALEAYQLAPALRILAKPKPSLLIADDVGLGKTIEAGLAMLELMARGRAARILIVTPPGLMDQWQQELLDKFGLNFALIDNASGLARAQTDLPAGINPWDAIPRIITSIDFIKKETIRTRALRKHWDLVVVDEAHALSESGTPRNPYRTQRTRLGLALRDAARGLFLLTATPHNGYSHSFRSLLELVEPTLATFAGQNSDCARRIEAARIRRMKLQIKRKLPDGSTEQLFPGRTVSGLPITEMTREEKDLLHRVASYCSRTARAAEGTEDADLVGFAMQIVKKRALSSRAAFARTLEHRLEALRKEEAREEPPDRAELQDLQADLPLGEAAAERTTWRVLRSAIPADEKRRKTESRALNAIRRILTKLPEKDPKVEPLLAAGIDGSGEQERILALLETDASLLPDDTKLERIVIEILGSDHTEPDCKKEGVFRLDIPWAYRGPGVKPVYPAATFRRSVAISYKPDEVEYLTPLHPLISSLAADARRRLLQAYPANRGLPPRRLAARLGPRSRSPSIVFTFFAAIAGGGGLLEECIAAIKVGIDGKIRDDPEQNLKLIEASKNVGEVKGEVLQSLFATNFDKLRDIALQEAQRWIKVRADSLRKRRSEQAQVLLNNLDTDIADRLREIGEEEKLSLGLIEATGQQRLFTDQDSKRGFEGRRAAVHSYAAGRKREIADFEHVEVPAKPASMGALFLVPEGDGL